LAEAVSYWASERLKATENETESKIAAIYFELLILKSLDF